MMQISGHLLFSRHVFGSSGSLIEIIVITGQILHRHGLLPHRARWQA